MKLFAKFEKFDAPDGQIAFVTPVEGVQFIHACVEAIRWRELERVACILLSFNDKMFCVSETTTLMDMIDEHDRAFDASTETKRCIESMTT